MTTKWHIENCLSISLTQTQRDQIDVLMMHLQETERALSSDRAIGDAMAQGHINYLLDLAQSSAGAFFIAITAQQVIGFCVVILTEEAASDLHLLDHFKLAGEVTDLVVDPNHQKRGIGRALIHAASTHCQARGVRQLKLKTLAQNVPARSAFEALGFRPHEVIHTIYL